ncbi:anaerobic ribonucleoside-triphosphate reductase activating protein [Idiomarina sp. OT37-5b]|jgi:anaerobic ribonucleoside-triphosphate reductase activating protein|uniref:Anaerobic ribonucleoside-triphosphate reductase activating protein n=1 Tax=Idiomarina aquatica TaxID=1327752 RepID=A0AA94JEB4_9GAMM|nr:MULTISPECIES: anaerobic ribonucleoside-triphosphate reductase activating protein [Idiomarina]AVJ54926.1 anaerobic ribonucleoside-triphosphate reductase activating protein [Idiomarina sp. OT37-5b]RUO45543.1 anaerobic ribonucleoside-triphosphate reductase activating protein [Idiomarina aquatica]
MRDALFRYCSEEVVFQEVPGEVSLAYTMTGCPVGCKGCHSADTWAVGSGLELTLDYLAQQLNRYQGFITCLAFMGGEWRPEMLKACLKLARRRGIKTCLYTGYDNVSIQLREHLDFLKTGPWVKELGGLDSPTTNQKFYDLRNQQVLNVAFQ